METACGPILPDRDRNAITECRIPGSGRAERELPAYSAVLTIEAAAYVR